jgi:2,3-bisphosphoglycerate-dependent phosphoglycerate mutase
MGRLILLRHGESVYNAQNLFTGWTDVDLSEKGREEAKHAGMVLAKNDLYPDVCFTSWLKRAIHTAQIALEAMAWEHIDAIRHWKLNERHYGAWQQRNKAEVEAEVGKEAFVAVRRGYATPPPPLSEDDPRHPKNDPKYAALDPAQLPRGESLEMTARRALNYYHEAIVPHLAREERVLVSAHGNSLRALVMGIEKLSAQEVVKLEIPTGVPILYRFDRRMQLMDKRVIGQ